jgi:hypothetical protein
MMSDTAVRITISPRGVEGLDIRGPLRGHPEALRLVHAVLPALGLLDATIRDFASAPDEGGAAAETVPTGNARP